MPLALSRKGMKFIPKVCNNWRQHQVCMEVDSSLVWCEKPWKNHKDKMLWCGFPHSPRNPQILMPQWNVYRIATLSDSEHGWHRMWAINPFAWQCDRGTPHFLLTQDSTICFECYWPVPKHAQHICRQGGCLEHLECQTLSPPTTSTFAGKSYLSQLRDWEGDEKLKRRILQVQSTMNVGLKTIEKVIYYWWQNYGVLQTVV